MTPNPTPIVLAVYGTLRRGEWNAPLLDGASFVGTGRVAGILREMPPTASRRYAYPSLVLDRAGQVAADDLEGYDPADEAGSEYVRRAVDVIDGPVARAWIYVYNGPPEEMGQVIASGDWIVRGTAAVARPAPTSVARAGPRGR